MKGIDRGKEIIVRFGKVMAPVLGAGLLAACNNPVVNSDRLPAVITPSLQIKPENNNTVRIMAESKPIKERAEMAISAQCEVGPIEGTTSEAESTVVILVPSECASRLRAIRWDLLAEPTPASIR